MTKFGETLSSATTFTKVHETDEVINAYMHIYFYLHWHWEGGRGGGGVFFLFSEPLVLTSRPLCFANFSWGKCRKHSGSSLDVRNWMFWMGSSSRC